MRLLRHWLLTVSVLSILLSLVIISCFLTHHLVSGLRGTTSIQEAVLRNWLQRTHVFVPSTHPFIRYHGRWVHLPRLARYDAGFAGASFEVAITNATSVYLSMANTAAHNFNTRARDQQALSIHPAEVDNIHSGPVDLMAGCNDAQALHHHAHGVVRLAQGLDRRSVCGLRVQTALNGKNQALSFKGLWVDKDAVLLSPNQASHGTDPWQHTRNETSGSPADTTLFEPDLLEVVMPEPYLRTTMNHSQDRPSVNVQNRSWYQLIANMYKNTSVSMLPYNHKTLLTKKRLQSSTTQDGIPDLQKLFFRSGPLGTDLYSHPWSFSYPSINRRPPTALILSAGLQNILDLLSFHKDQPETEYKHTLTLSIDEFSRTYSQFIQTIRRTAHRLSARPATAAEATQLSIPDESYQYISAPSTLPIFLLIPPLPSNPTNTAYRALKPLLRHATTKILDDLKFHIGDKNTFILDATGWLTDNSDFDTPPPVDAEVHDTLQFTLSRAGHVKFAYHLSLHLCRVTRGRLAAIRGGCAFERRDEYTGNMYLPAQADVEKVIEERRVRGVKDWLGMV